MNPFSARHAAVLRVLRCRWEVEQFLVIGASALACHLEPWRLTLDLDLSVASAPDGYQGELERLGWRRHASAPQRWFAPDGTVVDVVPGHPKLVEQGGFTWPEGGVHLNLVGLRLAFADAVTIDLDPGIPVRVASLRSLVVLKMAAYLDRPWDRESDLEDIAHVLREFVPADAEERWSEATADLDLAYDDVSPFFLGRQLAGLIDRAEGSLVGSFVGALEDPSDPRTTLYRMAARAPAGWKDPERLGERVAAFRRGFEGALRGPTSAA